MQWLALALLLAADSGQPVLPPGQDEAFATMLGRGATLPDGCVWSGALIDRSFVISQYTCGERLVKLTLKHESDVNAPNAIARTNRFVFFGEVPTGLRDELVTRVRAGEADIRWDFTAVPMPSEAKKPPPFPTALAVTLGLAVFVAMLGALTMRFAARRFTLHSRGSGVLRALSLVALTCAGGALLRDALVHSANFVAGDAQRASYASVFAGVTLGVALLALAASLLERRGGLLVTLSLVGAFVGWWVISLPRTPLPMFGAVSTLAPGVAAYPVNSRGFRGPEFALTKQPGVTRIALVGDSFVAGDGILAEDQTLAMHLQRELSARDPAGKYEVLNLGVGGNNFASHVDLANEALQQLDLDVLVVCLTLNNDLSSVDGQVLRSAARRLSAFSFARALFGEAVNTLTLRVTTGGHQATAQEIEHAAAQSARLTKLHAQWPNVKLVVFSFHRPEPELTARLEQPISWPRSFDSGDFIAGDGHPTDRGAQRFAQQLADLVQPPGAPK